MTTVNVGPGPEWVPWTATSETQDASGTVDATDQARAAAIIASAIGDGVVYDEVTVSHDGVAAELSTLLDA